MADYCSSFLPAPRQLVLAAVAPFARTARRNHCRRAHLDSFWTPLLYAALLVPGSSAWAGDPAAVPHIAGHVFYPNEAVAAVVLALPPGHGWRGVRSLELRAESSADGTAAGTL